MIPVAFDNENVVLNPPREPAFRDVEPLPVYQGPDSDGMEVTIACFKMSREELDEINRTGRVWIILRGEVVPIFTLDGVSPFK